MAEYTGSMTESQRQDSVDIVKCVVVGDTGVGKTRLICAYACGNKYDLPHLMQTHVSTVWAIDHYRRDKEVLERSRCTVDGSTISLRIWDTFGYHDKDRRFAYGRADVILCAFSVVRPRSLRSVVNHWMPEIQRCCPGVPIILVGCQIDLRYLYLDKHFLVLDKGPFFSEIKETDITTPERGRTVASEIHAAAYYETSVLNRYGLEEVFVNVIRAALINKREKHFWNMLGSLKRVSKPACQEPFMPPKPAAPVIVSETTQNNSNFQELFQSQQFSDVIFVAQGVCIPAHKICLVAASPAFEEIFLTDWSKEDVIEDIIEGNVLSCANGNHTNSCQTVVGNRNSSISHSNSIKRNFGVSKDRIEICQSDTVQLLKYEELDILHAETCELSTENRANTSGILLNHPAFSKIEFELIDDAYNPKKKKVPTATLR